MNETDFFSPLKIKKIEIEESNPNNEVSINYGKITHNFESNKRSIESKFFYDEKNLDSIEEESKSLFTNKKINPFKIDFEEERNTGKKYV